MADIKAQVVVTQKMPDGKIRSATITWDSGLTSNPDDDSYALPGRKPGADWVVSLANFIKMLNGCESELMVRVNEALEQATPHEPKIVSNISNVKPMHLVKRGGKPLRFTITIEG